MNLRHCFSLFLLGCFVAASASAQSYDARTYVLPLPGEKAVANTNMVAAAPAIAAQPDYPYSLPNAYYTPQSPSVRPVQPPVVTIQSSDAIVQPVSYQQAAPTTQPYQAAQRLPDSKPWYAGLKGGAAFLEDLKGSARRSPTTVDSEVAEFDTGYSLGALGGYRVHRNVRLEAELAYYDFEVDSRVGIRRVNGVVTQQQNFSTDNAGFEALIVMANGYIDLPIPAAPAWAPYIGAGIGNMWQRSGTEESALAYQGMIGVNYAANANGLVVGAGYKYLQAPDLIDENGVSFDAETHGIELSVRQGF